MSKPERPKPHRETSQSETVAGALHSAQERANIRLEVLRLAHRPDVSAEQVIDRCRALEAYVTGEQPADKP